MKKCRFCGKELPDDSLFCLRCGREVKDNDCPHCGFENLPEDALFCPVCGKAVKEFTMCPHCGRPMLKPVAAIASVHGSSSTFANTPSSPKPEQTDSTTQLPPVLQRLINNMVYIEGGTFTMGATPAQHLEAYRDEEPAHEVKLFGFSIGRYEVTQEEWMAVMESNPSNFNGLHRPVEQVSWNDCQDFIKKLNRLTGKQFRLPTEAEWEFAARGGNPGKNYDNKYGVSNSIGGVAWYAGNSGNQTHDVGEKSPNEIGLYDMIGNVWEWCQDFLGFYNSGTQTNPKGPSTGHGHVARGGSFGSDSRLCRVSSRISNSSTSTNCTFGLRLAL